MTYAELHKEYISFAEQSEGVTHRFISHEHPASRLSKYITLTHSNAIHTCLTLRILRIGILKSS